MLLKNSFTQWIRCKHTATTWEHQYAVEPQVQLHVEIRRRSKVIATLYEVRGCCPVAVADR